MVETSDPRITVDTLVRGMRSAARAGTPLTAASSRVAEALECAAAHAVVGVSLPAFAEFPRSLRPLLRLVARVVLYLARFITAPQTRFNVAVVDALRALADTELRTFERLAELETAAAAQSPVLDLPATHRRERLDALHVALQDEFRGSRDLVRQRLRTYLPLLREVGAAMPQRQALDLGCGRGEWLELLLAEGWHARGVDANPLNVADCRARGLQVADGDAVEYMRGAADESLGAVTAFHFVEHLSFERLIDLLDQTVRVLQPGGVAIFETPNPDNVRVSSCGFYCDPTHCRPLPSPLLRFLVAARGLCVVEVRPLHPGSDAMDDAGSEVAQRFNACFCGPQDYAVVARRL